MPTLTSQEGNELAMYFLGLAQAIGDYKFDNWNSLSDAEKDTLGKFQRSILNAGEDLLALSTTLVSARSRWRSFGVLCRVLG